MSTWSQSPVTAQGRTVLAVVFVAVLAGIGAALASCSDEQATTASEPSVDMQSADPTTSTHPEPELTGTESPPPTEPEPEPTPATQPPTPTQPEPDAADDEPSEVASDQPDGSEEPQQIEQPEQPVDGNDQTGSGESAVSEETLEAADLGLDGPRVLPWDDGYLQFGYRATGDDWDPTRVLVRDSVDGSPWSAYRPFPVPFEDLLADGASRWPIVDVTSDGQRLLFAVQGRHRIVVAITSDLIDWETVEIVPPEPDGLPHGVISGTSATHLALGPNGWLLHTSTDLGVSLWQLAPADIRDSAQYLEFDLPESQGLMVRWRTSEQEPAEPHHSRFVTWEELGIDEATYSHYGSAHFANKPYTPTELTSGAVWAASWGEAPVRTELPEIKGGTCCRIVGTRNGYFARAELGEPGYPPILDVEPPMFFSTDGSTWTAVEDTDIGEALGIDSAERVSQISRVRRLPWGEGFLEVGHPVVDEGRADRTQLFSRVSADGLDWSPLERLPIRLPDPQIDDLPSLWPYRRGGSVTIVASDGKRLVLAMLGEDTVVAISSDLTLWETIEIPAPSGEGLPDGVSAETSGIDLAIGPEGWLLLREVQLGVNPWAIAPADIRETARYIRLGDPDYVGGEYVQGESLGLEIDWETEQHEPGDPYFSRFVTWEELGIDEDTYREYGGIHFGNRPYSPSWLTSGEVWAAEWGNAPVRAALPEVSGGFWSGVVGTDAGYFARFYWGEAGYPQVVGPDYFSADGSNWVRRDTPVLNGLPFFADMSVVTDGIVLNGHLFYPPVYPDPATESESQLWLGDATGTNWRPVELPDLSEGSRFDLRYSRGGAVVKGGKPEDDSVGEWTDDSSVEWMMASRDGVNWLVVEDPAVGDLRGFVVNGNVMLAFDSQGNTHRFLLP